MSIKLKFGNVLRVGKIQLITLTAALGVLPFVAFTSSASAYSMYDCPTARFCLWNDINFQTIMISYPAKPSGTCITSMPSGWNDVASSLFNRLSQTVYIYEDVNCSGPGHVDPVTSNHYSADLTKVKLDGSDLNWNDRISSLYFL